MLKIGIIPQNGFLAWHLRVFLLRQSDLDCNVLNMQIISNKERLMRVISNCDVLIYCAGKNFIDHPIHQTSALLIIKRITQACQQADARPGAIFYVGQHPLCIAQPFMHQLKRGGSSFLVVETPEVFGEYVQPFHDSRVASFCYALTKGKNLSPISRGKVEIIYAQKAAEKIYRLLRRNCSGRIRLTGAQFKVQHLAEKLRYFAQTYSRQIIPQLEDTISLQLFNTYRSYLAQNWPAKFVVHTDNRGSVYEAIKSLNRGQVVTMVNNPGITRGNHYHTFKVERIIVLSGKAEFSMRQIFSEKLYKFVVSDRSAEYIDVPNFYTHKITNIGARPLIALSWVNELYDPQYPDIFPEPVEVEDG